MDDGFIEVLFLPCFIIFNLYIYAYNFFVLFIIIFLYYFIVVVWYDDLQQMIENQA